jgi:flagellar basal-body rod protein FlgF
MDPLTTAAASGMRSRMEALDILANNIANTSVPGFKMDRELNNSYRSSEASDDTTTQPVVQKNWTDFAQGALGTTGNDLNLALEGAGFLVANSPAGTLYTRAGLLKLSKDGDLVTLEGYTVQGQDGKPIKLDLLQPIEIDPAGVVSQGGEEVSRLAVVTFKDSGALARRGSTYFSSQASSPPEPATALVRQGQLEAANGQPSENAVRLIGVLRQFESLQKALSVGQDMNRRALDDVAKVA